MPPGLWRCRRPRAVRRAGGGRGRRGCAAHFAGPAIAVGSPRLPGKAIPGGLRLPARPGIPVRRCGSSPGVAHDGVQLRKMFIGILVVPKNLNTERLPQVKQFLVVSDNDGAGGKRGGQVRIVLRIMAARLAERRGFDEADFSRYHTSSNRRYHPSAACVPIHRTCRFRLGSPPVGECLNRKGLLRLQQDDTMGKAIKIGVHDEQLVTPR